ncbi:MAG TPA: acetoin utilization protein AcuC [Thermodesulfobacteriota bacterium]
MQPLYVYAPELADFDYGPCHPLKMRRLRLTYDLTEAMGLLGPGVRRVAPRPASPSQLEAAHDPRYLEVLAESESGLLPAAGPAHGLGHGDNPVFPGLFTVARLTAGASIEAADRLGAGEARVAMSIAGGLHHAMYDRASGFCYVNDPVLAIRRLLDHGMTRVAYVDIDVHHGDGVEAAFWRDDRVLTISLHQDGRTLFPGTGAVTDIGEGRGRGYAVNVPLLPGADDAVVVRAFDAVVPRFLEAFRPEAVVAQLGVDSFVADPLAMLDVTTNGFEAMVRRITELSPRLLALGGGGYQLANVARGWTLAWGIVSGQPVADTIPDALREPLRREGHRSDRLRDPEPPAGGFRRSAPPWLPDAAQVGEAANAVCRYLVDEVLPLVRR